MARVAFTGMDEVMGFPSSWAFGYSPNRPGGADRPCRRRERDVNTSAHQPPRAQEEPQMSEPRTELDARFSDHNATPTDWNETLRTLEGAELFWITTVRVDGRPHVTPLVAVWLDGAIHFTTGPEEQKAVNLRGNPHVILMTGCNQWDRGLDVVVEGDAVRVTDDQLLERLAGAWTTKWDGRWHFEAGDGAFHHGVGQALVFSVEPTKILTFGKGTFTHTRHRF
jgi:general stress protein 26